MQGTIIALDNCQIVVCIMNMRSASDDRTAWAVIRDEALRLFAERGPDAVSVRRTSRLFASKRGREAPDAPGSASATATRSTYDGGRPRSARRLLVHGQFPSVRAPHVQAAHQRGVRPGALPLGGDLVNDDSGVRRGLEYPQAMQLV